MGDPARPRKQVGGTGVPWRARAARRLIALSCGWLLAHVASAQTPLGTEFTYQGRLLSAGVPAAGDYEMRFTLHDALIAGNPVGTAVTLPTVSVTIGLFTVSLNFGAAAFVGDRRWLEVEVKPAGSPAAYVTLAPRQELTAAPNALWALKAADASTLGGIASSGYLLSGAVIPLAQGGTGATNATDARANLVAAKSGDNSDITSLSGLTTPLSIAQGGTGAVNAVDALTALNAQARLAASCPAGEYLRGVNADGSIVCGTFTEFFITITTLDDPPANQVGEYTSLAIGADGLPVISYRDATAAALKVAKCTNAACTAATITTVDDPADFVGAYTSIAVAPDSLPVISYRDNTSGALMVAKCPNPACSGPGPITNMSAMVGGTAEYTSIAVGSDNLPIISFHNPSYAALSVVKCANPACTVPLAIGSLDAPWGGRFSSIVIAPDNLPIISYWDSANSLAKVLKCANIYCTGGTITPLGASAGYTSIAIGADTLPIISYQDTANALRFAKCLNTLCNATAIATVDDPANLVGSYTSIKKGADGLPIMSYRDATAGALKVAKCLKATCTP